MAADLDVKLMVYGYNTCVLTKTSFLFLYTSNFVTQNGATDGAVHLLLYLNSSTAL